MERLRKISKTAVLLAGLILVIVFFLAWPRKVIVTRNNQGQTIVPDSPLVFGPSSKTLHNIKVWEVPGFLFYYWRIFGLSDDNYAVTKVIHPPTLELMRLKPELLPSPYRENALRFLEWNTKDRRDDVTFVELRNPEESISVLSDVDRAAGHFTINLDGKTLIKAERSGGGSSLDGAMAWRAIVDDKQRSIAQILIGDGQLLVNYMIDGTPSLIQPLGKGGQYYVITHKVLSTDPVNPKSPSGASLDLSQSARSYCKQYCVGKECYAGTPDYNDAGKGTDRRLIEVPGSGLPQKTLTILIVTSPLLSASAGPSGGIVPISLKASESFLGESFANLTDSSQIKLIHRAPSLEQFKTSVEADEAMWHLAEQLYNNGSLKAALNSNSAANGPYSALSSLLSEKNIQAQLAVYITRQPKQNYCGYASGAGYDERRFFAVVSANCLGDGTDMAHEVGHLLGGRHQPEYELQGEATAHGYTWPNWNSFAGPVHSRIGDVMSTYVLERIPYFSNSADGKCDNEVIGNVNTASSAQIIVDTLLHGRKPDQIYADLRCHALRPPRNEFPDAQGLAIHFDSSAREPTTPEQISERDKALAKLISAKPAQIVVFGYSDAIGDSDKNVGLSYARAQSTSDYIEKAFKKQGLAPPEPLLCPNGAFFTEETIDKKTYKGTFDRRVEIRAYTSKGTIVAFGPTT